MKKAFLLLLLLASGLRGVAQSGPGAAWETRFFEQPAATLPRLVEAAARHSAELKALGAEKAMVQEELQMARKAIFSSVLLTNSVGYGNIANVALTDQSVAAVRTANAARHYATGLNVNLPLDRLLNRRHQIQRQQLQGQRFEHLAQAQRDALGQRVIDLYQSVLLSRRVLELRQQSYVNAQLNVQLVEKQFRTGEAQLSDVALLQDRFVNATIERENAASKYTTALLLLEDVVGGRVSDLLAQP